MCRLLIEDTVKRRPPGTQPMIITIISNTVDVAVKWAFLLTLYVNGPTHELSHSDLGGSLVGQQGKKGTNSKTTPFLDSSTLFSMQANPQNVSGSGLGPGAVSVCVSPSTTFAPNRKQ